MPTNKPNCTLPEITTAEVSAIRLVAIVKNMPGRIKQMSDRTQSTMFAPALSDGALISTKMKFSTPNTTARYRSNTESITRRSGVPSVCAPARLMSEPQLSVSKVFRVKFSKVKAWSELLKKGSETE